MCADFDLLSIEERTKCLVIGGDRKSRTELVRDICYYKRHIPGGNVICDNGSYDDIVPACFHNSIASLQKSIDYGRKCRGRRRHFLIMDVDSPDFNSNIWRTLMFNGKSFG